MIQDEQELKDILTKSWSQKTSSKWTKECPSCGQCSVTALVIQDRYGGSILKTKVGGSWHFYNSINGACMISRAISFRSGSYTKIYLPLEKKRF